MKQLGLLRHAKSDWDDLNLRDFDRGLNDRGRKGADLMAQHISEYSTKWDLILASPAERVRRTLAAGLLDAPVQYEGDAYLADSSTLISLLNEMDESHAAILLAAHNPGLQELAVELVAEENRDDLVRDVMNKFPTCAFAVLELDIGSWAECRPGCGKLIHFARPRDLDPELGPSHG